MPHTMALDALEELVEVFSGLSNELEWATSDDVYRKELLPLFNMVASGTLSPSQGLDVVLSNVTVKRDETFAVMLRIVQRLNTQLAEYDMVRNVQKEVVEEGALMEESGTVDDDEL